MPAAGASLMTDGLTFSERAQRVPPFHVMDILARARELQNQGRDIIHLEVGEPDFPTPEPIARAGQQAISRGNTFYTPALGLPLLREHIAHWYEQRFAVSVDPRRVVVTPGASGALLLAMAALINPGDVVLLSDPGYPCNRTLVHSFGGVPRALHVSAASGWQLSAAQIEANGDARMAVVATPGNPTGAVTSLTTLRQLAAACRQQRQVLLVDEIYQGLNYGDAPCTAAALGEDVWIVNSFSKFFQMTGWRLGWLLAPTEAIPVLDRLQQNLFLAAPSPAQYAALAAFDPDTLAILEQRRQELDRRRRFLLRELPGLGLQLHGGADGAFYIYADVSGLCPDSQAWCEQLLQHGGIAITPGLDFGDYRSRRHVRIAYTQPLPVLEQALHIMHELIRRG